MYMDLYNLLQWILYEYRCKSTSDLEIVHNLHVIKINSVVLYAIYDTMVS